MTLSEAADPPVLSPAEFGRFAYRRCERRVDGDLLAIACRRPLRTRQTRLRTGAKPVRPNICLSSILMRLTALRRRRSSTAE